MTKSAPVCQRAPDYLVDIEPCPQRVRVQFGKTLMTDWTRILVTVETQQVPIYYFSRDDLAAVNLRATERTTYYPLKGAVFHWSEEEETFARFCGPHKRVDAIQSKRLVKNILGRETATE